MTDKPLISDEAWEALCKGCGLCCFEKRLIDSNTFETTRESCRYLDIVSRRCKVYDKRFQVEKSCVKLTPKIVRQVDWLPKECAYVQFMEQKFNQ